MINIEKTAVMNFENAVRGARNPMSSWERMDSYTDSNGSFVFGANDLTLAKRLCHAGSDHRKFIRQIFVSVDITAPLYWWKEFDTYKIGTTANSTSTMHKIHAKPFSEDDFSVENLLSESTSVFHTVIVELERLRQEYMLSKDKGIWYGIIQLLPSSYHQTRTCTMSYENLISMYFARKNHKLNEWREFCIWIENLPYFRELFLVE